MSSTIHCIDLKKDLEEGFEPVEENKDKNRPKPRDFLDLLRNSQNCH